MLHVVSDPSSLSVVVAAALQRQQAQRAVFGHGPAAAANQRQRLDRNGSSDSASLDQQQLPWSVTNNGTNSVSNTGSNGGNSSPRYATFKQQLKAAAGNTFSPRPSASGQVNLANSASSAVFMGR
jgi:hypothetical protein